MSRAIITILLLILYAIMMTMLIPLLAYAEDARVILTAKPTHVVVKGDPIEQTPKVTAPTPTDRIHHRSSPIQRSPNEVSPVHAIRPDAASTAYAPSINPTVNCASVVGFGAQGAPFGLSLGGSRQNADCERLELAKTTMMFGDRDTAEEILCESELYRGARKRTGRPCAETTLTNAESRIYSGTDEVVRYRHGLPPAR